MSFFKRNELLLIIFLNIFSCNQNAKYEYWDNGNKKSALWYDNRIQISSEKYWDENGNLKFHYFDINIDTIEVEDSLSDDILIQVLRSEQGVEYYANGHKKKYFVIIKGLKEKTWQYWNKEGRLVREEIYSKDSLVNTIFF